MGRLPWDSSNRVEKTSGVYQRERSSDLYHTYRWTKLSAAFRAAHPLCAECNRKGIIKPATVVDHIIPYPICKDYFFDRSNLQSLCDECNHEKGQRDKRLIGEWRRSTGGGKNL